MNAAQRFGLNPIGLHLRNEFNCSLRNVYNSKFSSGSQHPSGGHDYIRQRRFNFVTGDRALMIRIQSTRICFSIWRIAHDQIDHTGNHFGFQFSQILTENCDSFLHPVTFHIKNAKIRQFFLDLDAVQRYIRVPKGQYQRNDPATGTQIKNAVSGVRPDMVGQQNGIY
jgi:hypothetical protein